MLLLDLTYFPASLGPHYKKVEALQHPAIAAE